MFPVALALAPNPSLGWLAPVDANSLTAFPGLPGAPEDSASSWSGVLHAIEELREFFRDYSDLMQNTWSPEGMTEEKRTLVLFHHGLFQQKPSPLDQISQVADAYRKLLDVIRRENLSFRIPTRSGLIPETENPALVDISLRVKDFNSQIERLLSQVHYLEARSATPELEDRLRSLYASIGSLFKAMVRQDWDDVNLVLNHVNLVTTSSKSRGLVRQMAQMARDIYNSLNAFSAEYRVDELSQSTQEIPDAVDKLRSVISRLEEYANANLDALEHLNQELAEDRTGIRGALAAVEECIADLDQLATQDPSLAESLSAIKGDLAKDVSATLQAMLKRLEENQEAYLALIARMSFQDLTGQTLKKVIAFIEKLEFQLISLISRHHDERAAVTMPESEVPLEGPDAQGRLALSQESVDKVLADLGF